MLFPPVVSSCDYAAGKKIYPFSWLSPSPIDFRHYEFPFLNKVTAKIVWEWGWGEGKMPS
jgi:hypothetical protein